MSKKPRAPKTETIVVSYYGQTNNQSLHTETIDQYKLSQACEDEVDA